MLLLLCYGMQIFINVMYYIVNIVPYKFVLNILGLGGFSLAKLN